MCSYFPALQDSNTMSLSKGQNIYICTASVSINGRKLFCLMGDKVEVSSLKLKKNKVYV